MESRAALVSRHPVVPVWYFFSQSCPLTHDEVQTLRLLCSRGDSVLVTPRLPHTSPREFPLATAVIKCSQQQASPQPPSSRRLIYDTCRMHSRMCCSAARLALPSSPLTRHSVPSADILSGPIRDAALMVGPTPRHLPGRFRLNKAAVRGCSVTFERGRAPETNVEPALAELNALATSPCSAPRAT